MDLDIPVGTSLMQAAVTSGLGGIQGECGGTLGCATCHVFVDPEQAAALPAMLPAEAEMLDFTAAPRRAESRLGCQIRVSESLDGLRVTIADPQT